ncbi:HDIG domain-containing metalloprotein [Pumilibacter intestinalis]|uniref:HDIG domain-containing metalloprotein n=1 Tax=Pumilibacter intestinalis TaxID=2941511 RepID=UPI0020404E3D|nr:HDIG domain-containing metalloprotein [Pumilibacter intestinalis]
MDKAISAKKSRRGAIARAFCIYFAASAVIVTATVLKFALIEHIRDDFSVLSYMLFSAVIAIILLGHFLYVVCSRRKLLENRREFGAIYAAMAFTVIANVYLETINSFLMPAMLAAFVISALSNGRDAFCANIFTNVLILFILLTQNRLTGSENYYTIVSKFAQGLTAGTIVAYWLSGETRRFGFIIKGLIVAVLSVVAVFAVVAAFGEHTLTLADIAYLSGGTLGQVFLAVVLQPIFEAIFNLVTDMRLVELTDHNAPLVKRLKEEAPGTFIHSLAVANFAEVCASAIGENPYLARACAYYHDVGKLMNPLHFKENQPDGNPHDGLLPEVSAEIIRSHSTEGKKLCDEYRIPPEVSDVTVEHHGTLPIYVFYNKAKQLTDGDVNIEDYSYHGHTPVSKIAAIIMLCDSGEAAIRAMDNPDAERVDNLLRKLISDRINAGQFDDCDITLRDLDVIRRTIIAAYGGQFHKRIKYGGLS